MMIRPPSSRGTRGTALVEFCICIVAVVIILAGFIQIISVGVTRSNHLEESTRLAVRSMMLSGESDDGEPVEVGSGGMPYLRDWDVGADNAPHTADDRWLVGDTSAFYEDIHGVSRPDRLEAYVPDNDISALTSLGNLNDGYRFVRGSAPTEGVPVLPFVRRFMYNAEEIDVETEAVFPWTKGLY